MQPDLSHCYNLTASLRTANLEPSNHFALRHYKPLIEPGSCLLSKASDLKDTREDGEALLLVFVAEFLAIPTLLLLAPRAHLRSRNNQKQDGAQTPAHKSNTDPRKDLKEVVRARNEIETDATGNAALGGAWASQVLKYHVRVKVEQFADDKEGYAGVGDERVRSICSWAPRSIGPESEVDTRQGPVVCTVLENVACRHRGGREPVHEQGLILTLDEV